MHHSCRAPSVRHPPTRPAATGSSNRHLYARSSKCGHRAPVDFFIDAVARMLAYLAGGCGRLRVGY
jgi:hypothetical protein